MIEQKRCAQLRRAKSYVLSASNPEFSAKDPPNIFEVPPPFRAQVRFNKSHSERLIRTMKTKSRGSRR